MLWPVCVAWEEEGLGFSRPSQQRVSFSFLPQSPSPSTEQFHLVLGKEGAPHRNAKVQSTSLVFFPQPVNTFWGTAEEGHKLLPYRIETRQWSTPLARAQSRDADGAGSHSLSSSSDRLVQGRLRLQQELLNGSDTQGTSWAPLFMWSSQDRQHGEAGPGGQSPRESLLPALGATAG